MSARAYDVAIVGGGLIGCWAALLLARRGQSVVLLEMGEVGAQSSGVNFGNLRLQGRFEGQYPLSLRAQAIWEEFERLTGESCEFAQTGYLYVAHAEGEREQLERYAQAAERHGIAITRVPGAALRRRWPWLGEGLHAATYSERDATANPRLATPATARAAQRFGAEFRERCRVTAIRRAGDAFLLDLEGGAAVSCGSVVNATGAWAVAFAEMFGETAPLVPAGPPQFVTDPIAYRMLPVLQAVNGTVIARQIPRGNVIFAGYPRTASDPVLNRAPVPPRKTLAGMAHLARIAPFLRNAHLIRVWSGIEGYLPDMLPVIGPSETTPGLYHAFGGCGHGFQIGPGVGEVLADLIVDGRTDTPIAPFSIGRFRGQIAVSAKFVREFDPPETPDRHSPRTGP